MNICVKCRHSWFFGSDGYHCLFGEGKQSFITGERSYPNCGLINTDGKCPNYQERLSAKEEFAFMWKSIINRFKI